MRLLVGLGELALLEGAPEKALAFAEQALAVAGPTGSRKHAGRALLLSGRARLAAGAPLAEALAQLEQARSLARACDHPPLLWSSARQLAALHARLGQAAEAAACLAEARAAVEAVAGDIHDLALKRSFLGADPVQRALADA
jgi:tetratricopeptide (TPR) repeat protein